MKTEKEIKEKIVFLQQCIEIDLNDGKGQEASRSMRAIKHLEWVLGDSEEKKGKK